MNLRVIPTSVHGVLDYVTGSALLAAPELFRLKDVPSAALTPRLTGAGATAYSLLTDYELGAVRLLPMPVHLALDAMSGALLATSPWLLGYAKNGPRYWLPHALVGASEILAALATKTQPPRRRVMPGLMESVRRYLGG
ncbi:MAG: hypothetical protein M3315_16030 [Actinomycetota bacterium]|jgi:hypothetical protein|nr:hypothetical protein [Actinomycetota bacterium]